MDKLNRAAVDDGILTAKAIAMGVLFSASLLIGSLPFLLAHWLHWNTVGMDGRPERRRAVSLALAVGGGILLATTFLHLLPEVRSTIAQLQAAGELPHTSFALAEMLMCVGFFVIYAVSEVVHGYIQRHNAAMRKRLECTLHHESPPNDGAIASSSSASTTAAAQPSLAYKDAEANCDDHQQHDHHHSHLNLPADGNDDAMATDSVTAALRGLLIVLALSVHELFEGMALGLERRTADVWLLFGAISAHKLVLAFCVGIELMVARTRLKLAFCYVAVFAVVSPLGIGIGMLVTGGGVTTAATSTLVGGVLQAMATGTLVYVVFFEILKKGGAGLRQLAAVVVGFAVMFGLQQLSGHEHSHEDTHDALHLHGLNTDDGASGHHEDHSHVDELRHRMNLLKQAGRVLAQANGHIGDLTDTF